jgi:hypothetical protein
MGLCAQDRSGVRGADSFVRRLGTAFTGTQCGRRDPWLPVKGSHESTAICSIAFRGISCLCPAHAEKRVALVIGMSNYQQVPRLPNPTRDASATANLFRKAGFDLVKDERDQGIADLRRACDFRSGSKGEIL